MSKKGKEASTEFVIPYFDLVVITAGNDEGLVQVEVDTADWTVVFFKSIDYCSNTVVPTMLLVMINDC